MLQKKGTALLLSALLLASALPLAAYAEEVSAKTTEYVNFRSGPGTNYSSQGIIASGTTITVTDTSNSEWYAVRLSDGSTGYIYAEYISVSGSNTTEDGEVNAKTTADVNFRSGPGTNYNSKAVIGSGTGIIVTDTSNSQWYAVRLTNGSTGYIYAEYIRITGDVGTPSAPAEPTPAPSNPEAEQTAKTTEYVNFRTGPGTNYSSKGVISLGTTVTVTDTSNSQWYAVRLSNGSTGYIFAQYLKLTGNTSAPTATPAPSDPANEKTAKTTEYVNFRTGPGTNYSSKGVIPSGTAITVTDTSNSQWYAVRLADGSTGYIYAQYIKITSATAMPAPTEAPADGTVRAKTTADVNLRKGAGTNYGVIRVVGNNTAVTVTEATNTWYKVKLSDGTEGYLYASTLPSPPATSTASRKRRPPIPPRSPKPNRKQSPSSIRSAGTCARPTTGPHTHFRITRSARRSPATAFIPNGTQTSALTITRVTATSVSYTHLTLPTILRV